MPQFDATVIDTEPVGPFVRVALGGPALALPATAAGITPGRFLLALLDGYLRSPLFPARCPSGADDRAEFETLVAPDHPAARLARGATVNLLGPLGRGFEVPPASQRLLLVANGARLPLLLGLALQELARGRAAALLVESPSAAQMLPIALLPPALEVRLVTADGSGGERGTALTLFGELARWADCICLADDPARYPLYAHALREARIGPARGLAQALVVPPLACGVGACQGCAVRTVRGVRLACSDGPVFDLLELQ